MTRFDEDNMDMQTQTVGETGNHVSGEPISREAAITAVVLYGENCMGAERAIRALKNPKE